MGESETENIEMIWKWNNPSVARHCPERHCRSSQDFFFFWDRNELNRIKVKMTQNRKFIVNDAAGMTLSHIHMRTPMFRSHQKRIETSDAWMEHMWLPWWLLGLSVVCCGPISMLAPKLPPHLRLNDCIDGSIGITTHIFMDHWTL